ncbi:hypothetical protein GCM10009127_18150 [Alteraurantiacibacter aestuarii]|uniref:hypothetical protein n=1 Tax=Alteraurantiacibacter aestuarii TaxID=650004 RepID=UPI0031D53B0B
MTGAGRMVWLSSVLLSALLAASAAQAQDQAESDVYAVVIEIWPLDGEPNGYYCPPDQGEDVICLGASILVQKGGLERAISQDFSRTDPRVHAATTRDVDGRYIRFRMIGGHAWRRIPNGRYLAVIEPTAQNYIYVQWYEGQSGDRACFPDEVIAHYGDRLDLPEMLSDHAGRTCFDLG